MRPNRVRELWRQGKPAIGSLLTLHSPLMAEVMGHVGFDWLGADLQHSETNLDGIQGMFQAVSNTPAMPFTRVAGNDSILIQRVLDLGAYGIIVPYVQTAEEAEAAVRAGKYPPRGVRSWGPIRGVLYGGADYFDHANDETVLLMMLETRQAVENARAILSVPGVDGCFIGPNDLGITYGERPEGGVSGGVEEAIQEILAAAQATGTVAGIQTFGAEEVIRRADQGFRFIGLSSDVRLAAGAARRELATVRQQT
ncbi:MAG: HpcH/HpaI aldolase/citrate lyase family protein [Chloroflexota bacterium]